MAMNTIMRIAVSLADSEHIPDFIQAFQALIALAGDLAYWNSVSVNNLTRSSEEPHLKDKEIEDIKKDGAS